MTCGANNRGRSSHTVVWHAVVLAGLVAACGDPGAGNVTVAITSSTRLVRQGLTLQLHATALTGAGDTLVRQFTWSSGNPAVASVGGLDGIVQGVIADKDSVTITAATLDGQATIRLLVVPVVTGSWTGSSSEFQFSTTIQETATGAFTGSGVLSGSGGDLSVTIHGSHSHPDVEFTITDPGFKTAFFSGTMTGTNAMTGILTGSGFVGQTLSMTRH